MKKAIKKLYAQANTPELNIGNVVNTLNPIKGLLSGADMVNNVVNQGGKLIDTATQAADDKGDPKTEAGLAQLSDLDKSERDMRTKLIGLGVPESELDQFVDSLMSQGGGAGLGRVQAYQAIFAAAQMAQMSGVGFETVFPIIKATAKSRHYNLQETLDVLGGIAKYAEKFPGFGIWQMASATARGKNVADALFFVRELIMAANSTADKSARLAESAGLYQAIAAITTPGSPITQLVGEFADAHQKTLQQREQFGLEFSAINAAWQTQTEIQLGKLYNTLNKELPKWSKTPWFNAYMQSAATVAAGSALIKNVANTALFKPGLTPRGVADSTGVGMGSGQLNPAKNLNINDIESLVHKAFLSEAAKIVLSQSNPATQPPSSIGSEVNKANQTTINTMNGQGQGAYNDLKTKQPINYDIEQKITVLQSRLELMENGYKSIAENLQGLMNMMVSGTSSGESDISVAYLSPQDIEEMASNMITIALEGLDDAKVLYNLLTTHPADFLEALKKADMKNTALQAGTTVLESFYKQKVGTWTTRVIQAKCLLSAGPSLQNIKTAQPYYAYYKQQTEASSNISQNYYMGQFAQPLQKICMYMSNQYLVIANNFKKALMQDQAAEGDAAKFVQTARQLISIYTTLAQAKQTEAVSIAAQLNKGVYGGDANNPGLAAISRHSQSNKFNRLSEKDEQKEDKVEEKTATTTQEEWNLIYQGTDAGGYGTVLKNPGQYLNVPTVDVAPSGKVKNKKRFRRINLNR